MAGNQVRLSKFPMACFQSEVATSIDRCSDNAQKLYQVFFRKLSIKKQSVGEDGLASLERATLLSAP